jgi:hypothetical protein
MNDAFKKELKDCYARIAQLEAALRAAYEVYAGSDGFVPETCAEGYQRQIITQMVGCISAALKGRP